MLLPPLLLLNALKKNLEIGEVWVMGVSGLGELVNVVIDRP